MSSYCRHRNSPTSGLTPATKLNATASGIIARATAAPAAIAGTTVLPFSDMPSPNFFKILIDLEFATKSSIWLFDAASPGLAFILVKGGKHFFFGTALMAAAAVEGL